MCSLLMILFEPDIYLWLMLLLLVALSVLLYLLVRRSHRWWLRHLVFLAIMLVWLGFIYGAFWEVRVLTVRRVEFASADLPSSFDGYRIVHFSDVHVGSLTGWRQSLLHRVVDSINAQHADLIVFTGDLQNKLPSELPAHQNLLSGLKARDGICSVLGNHDYPSYIDCDDSLKNQYKASTCAAETAMGWQLLLNTSRLIRRGADSLVVAGMENDGEGRFPQQGDISAALSGIDNQAFVVMLEHDPTSWHRKILPESHCQLTLSGHTHGGQVSLFGWTSSKLHYREDAGMYYDGDRAMNVSTGVGGVIPFRFGIAPEIVVVTLRKKK